MLICLTGVSVGLPIAWISLAKFLVFLGALAYLVLNHGRKKSTSDLKHIRTTPAIFAIVLVFAVSLLWTSSDQEVALLAFSKHARILEILLLLVLTQTALEARIALKAFVAAQTFLLSSSWLMAAGVPIPWATSHMDGDVGRYVVFSTYLDQSIIFATSAAIVWHLRSEQLWPRWFSGVFALAALINVTFLLGGRTGFVVALTLVSLAVMWWMPKRWRLISLLVTPLVALALLYSGSAHVKARLGEIIQGSQAYANKSIGNIKESSSGWRLNAWHRSIQAIQERPLQGHGVGSWTLTVKRIEGQAANQVFGEGKSSNPHQEYLLWGVELGIGGTLLFLLLLACLVRDALQFRPAIARATISAVAAMAVACLFNSSLYDALIGDYFCVALGLLLALGVNNADVSSSENNIESNPQASGAVA